MRVEKSNKVDMKMKKNKRHNMRLLIASMAIMQTCHHKKKTTQTNRFHHLGQRKNKKITKSRYRGGMKQIKMKKATLILIRLNKIYKLKWTKKEAQKLFWRTNRLTPKNQKSIQSDTVQMKTIIHVHLVTRPFPYLQTQLVNRIYVHSYRIR